MSDYKELVKKLKNTSATGPWYLHDEAAKAIELLSAKVIEAELHIDQQDRDIIAMSKELSELKKQIAESEPPK